MGLSFLEAERALARFKNRGWRLGVDRMEEFCRRLGLEAFLSGAERPLVIHVAGTNGKGSTVRLIQSILTAHGLKTGASYSPFVETVRERSQVDGELISEEEFARITELLLAAGEGMEETDFGGPTEFEMKTAMGFLHWRDAAVDAIVVETGLGGRLDATNVVVPDVSVITSIGLDHTEYLGSRLQDIAFEKAGIIKSGAPCVMGRLEADAAGVIRDACGDRGCSLFEFGTNFGWLANGSEFDVRTAEMKYRGLTCGLEGRIQHENAAVAIMACEAAEICLDPALVSEALASARLPGRMERVIYEDREVLLDGAHNAEAAVYLAESLRDEERDICWICGFMQGHDAAAFLEPISRLGGRLILTWAFGDRGQDPHDVLKTVPMGFSDVAVQEKPSRALAAAGDHHGLIVVTGSFYLVGRLSQDAGLSPRA
jgi:dihydrofolate synthase/folylpolyglutamate synthase